MHFWLTSAPADFESDQSIQKRSDQSRYPLFFATASTSQQPLSELQAHLGFGEKWNLSPTCSGLQSKTAVLAINAIFGSD
ncbi:hypothetical protein I5Q65_30000 [Pseudomonas aeruginosa]|nr:hypothetical protein [Pseudomonas aeruginosa]